MLREYMTGVELIRAERLRQLKEEGWSEDHDSEHDSSELAMAAMCYACPPNEFMRFKFGMAMSPVHWPFDETWWKPSPDDRIRELVKAGALIAAEIDRLSNE